jgi:hypothetical protein
MEKLPRGRRPAGTLKGTEVSDAIPVYLREPLLRDLIFQAQSASPRCSGGVFVGKASEDEEGRFVEAIHFLPAVGDPSASSTFTFTPEMRRDLASQAESSWPELNLVGWSFSQPGMGVFLSEVCANSHRSFFPLPWQFAVVVDPTRQSLGFFGWVRSEILPIGFHFVSAS